MAENCETCLDEIDLKNDSYIKVETHRVNTKDSLVYFCSEECLLESII